MMIYQTKYKREIGMGDHHQFGSGEPEEAVLNRLRLLERVYDPVTTRHLASLGVARGWNCLEVGAGAGSVATWLSAKVRPEGKIVATDINTRFLHQIADPNIEVRRHDILADHLEENQYDLVHCRTLLMWLRDPEKALRKMADAVRPGGWLMLEETDYGSILSVESSNPSAAVFSDTWRTGIDFLRKNKIADPYFGRQIRNLIDQLGFIEGKNEGWTRICRGGEPMARFDLAAVQMAAQPMINAGLLASDKLEMMQGLLMDTTFDYPGLTMFSSWGRKPGER
ncbi:MAG TPA: methyltransferase domain-containing protein [Methanoregulaceae archaeon]|nr:methyltransferase domain-containing protein [Methanoregulaceae archaeon]